MKWLLVISIGVFLIACSNKKKVPGHILPPEKMGRILNDMAMSEDFVTMYVTKDTTKKREVEIQKEYQKIYALNDTDEETFNRSYTFYKANPPLLKTVLDGVHERNQKERDRANYAPGAY